LGDIKCKEAGSHILRIFAQLPVTNLFVKFLDCFILFKKRFAVKKISTEGVYVRIGAFELDEPIPELNEPYAFVILKPWIDVNNVGTLF
jgi:hypothetical protein